MKKISKKIFGFPIKMFFAVFFLAAVAAFFVPSFADAAADPNVMQETQDLLSYFEDLPNRSESRVLSGQQVSSRNGDGTIQEIYSQSGERPAIIGIEYGYASDLSDRTAYAIDYAKNGGVITVSWHQNNPASGGDSWDGTYVDLTKMITNGDSLNTTYKKELDRIAAGLQQFESAGVTVLFRPYHELNGSWFWWGGKSTTEFKNLWRYTFDYLTNTKGLHNLLWLYNLNADVGNYTAYYPGSAYVDMVGLDYYGSGNLPKLGGYEELLTLGKPFAVNEFGPCDSGGGAACDAPKDNTLIIRGIKDNMPETTHWLNWHSGWRLSKHNNLKELLDDPWVVNQGEINNEGNYSSCTPDWQCSGWSVCSNGQQTQTCTDSNDCGTTAGRPATTRSCGTSGCTDFNFISGSVSPTPVSPGGSYTTQCDYGTQIDSIDPNPGSGTCSWTDFTGTTANFVCTAGQTSGTFSNACSLRTGTSDNTCARQDGINDLTVTGSAQSYCGDQSCDTDSGETCSTCAGDCGTCPITPPPTKTYTLTDFTNLLADWLKSMTGSLADVNLDNKVNSRDLGIMMSNWAL